MSEGGIGGEIGGDGRRVGFRGMESGGCRRRMKYIAFSKFQNGFTEYLFFSPSVNKKSFDPFTMGQIDLQFPRNLLQGS